MKKKIIKILVGVIFLALFTAPLVMMLKMSQKEMGDVIQNSEYFFEEMAYGMPIAAYRTDMEHYVKTEGIVTSSTYSFIEINAESPSGIRIITDTDNEVHKGEIVGYAEGVPVISNYDGIVTEICTDNGGYIKLQTFDNPVISCYVSERNIEMMKKAERLEDDEGNILTIEKISNICSEEGIEVLLKCKDDIYQYGAVIPDLKIYTGIVFTDILVVDKSCVYKRSKNGVSYVRLVDEDRHFIREISVETGYENENVVSVSNITEGALCDSGYKKIVDFSGGSDYD